MLTDALDGGDDDRSRVVTKKSSEQVLREREEDTGRAQKSSTQTAEAEGRKRTFNRLRRSRSDL